MERHPHILDASTNLLGICFVIIGGLKLANASANTYADEIAWVGAALFFTSATVAYFGIRNDGRKGWQLQLADKTFIAGLVTIMISVLVGSIQL